MPKITCGKEIIHIHQAEKNRDYPTDPRHEIVTIHLTEAIIKTVSPNLTLITTDHCTVDLSHHITDEIVTETVPCHHIEEKTQIS